MGFATTNVAATVGQGVPPFDPIGTMEKLAYTRNLFNQARLFQAERAGGNAFLQAANQPGGVTSQNVARSLAATGNPDVGLVAPEYVGAAGTQAGTNIANAQTRVGALMHAVGAVPRLADGSVDSATAQQILQMGVSSRLWTQDDVNNFAGGNFGPEGPAVFKAPPSAPATPSAAPPTGAPSPPAGAVTPGLIDTAANYAGEPSTQFGNVQEISTPAGTVPVKVLNTSGGPVQTKMEGTVANPLGPAQLATQVETTDATGAKKLGVLGDFVNPDGSWKSGQPHPLTALGPMDAQTLGTLGASYGPQIAGFEQYAAGAPGRKLNIDNMRSEASQIVTGPNADTWQTIGEYAHEYGVPLPDLNPNQTANLEALKKSYTMILSQQQQRLGMDQTDAARQTAQAAVPSNFTTPEGMKKVFGIIEGNEDMAAAQAKAWQAQKAAGGPASWGQFQMEFPQRVPPSIFQAQYMTPQEIQRLQTGWSAAQKSEWQARFDLAKKFGWLPNVGGAQYPGPAQ